MIPTAIKQTTALAYWAGLAGLLQQPAIPIGYAFAGAIGLGLFVTLIWILSPMLTGRLYRQRIRELETRLTVIETKLETTIEANLVLREQNVQFQRDNDALLNHIHRLSYDMNSLKAKYGEVADS